MSSPARPATSYGYNSRLTPALVTHIRRSLADRRMSIEELARELKVTSRTVECAAYGWTWRSVTDPPPLCPPEPQDGEPPTFALLTPQIVAGMRLQYRAGQVSFAKLARQHHVAESTVRNAVLGYTWRSVAEPPVERADVGGWTVVSEADEREIVRRRDNGKQSFRAIAAVLGHDVAVVHRAYQRLRPPASGINPA